MDAQNSTLFGGGEGREGGQFDSYHDECPNL